MTRWRRRALMMAVCAVGGLATVSPVRANEVFKQLMAKEIRAKVIGRDLTDGVHWSWYFRPDGALISMELAKRRVGSWKIEDNRLCREKEKGKQIECYEVWMSRKTVSLRFFEDMPAFEATVEPHSGP